MGLNDGTVGAAVAVTDMDRAIDFYEGKLGLNGVTDVSDGGRTYRCAEGSIHIFPSPHARASGATIAGFVVEDVEGTVDELIANGVTFEQYSEGPFATDEKGLARIGEFIGAWVKDPDGNVLAIGNS